MTEALLVGARRVWCGPAALAALHAALTIVAFLVPCRAMAAGAEPPSAAAQAEQLARELRSRHPETRIDSVAPSIVPGLFEVVMGRNVAYVEPGGRFFLFGHVWDMDQRRDLTADRRQALDRTDVLALPTGHALTTRYGTGRFVLHVFADPQCGYCRQLERSFQDLKDATVYTYLLPILGPRSRQLAEAIHCAPQPAKAWHDWMLQGVEPPAPAAACDPSAPVDAVERAANSLGVRATPTLIAGDGRKRSGAMPVEQLQAWLATPDTAQGTADDGRAEGAAQSALVTRKTAAVPPGAASGITRKANP